jgi:hypothetical protein
MRLLPFTAIRLNRHAQGRARTSRFVQVSLFSEQKAYTSQRKSSPLFSQDGCYACDRYTNTDKQKVKTTTMYAYNTHYTQLSGTTDFVCAGLHVTIHEPGQKLQLNGRSIALTPTEYRLCTIFFQRWLAEKREPLVRSDGMIMLSYLTTIELQRKLALASQQLLRKHISNANGKLIAHNVQIRALAKGYVLLRITEEESEEGVKISAIQRQPHAR